MMSLSEIRSFYPEHLHQHGAFLLREYLQIKILEILFQSEFANHFAFLGGTCLRLIHSNQRFSEDLDFDNFDISESDFLLVAEHIKKKLAEQGFDVEIRNVLKSAFHCYVRFPGILFDSGLSSHKEAKILINLDTEPQRFSFKPETPFINKFDVFTSIRTTPLDLLLSQKFLAITQRKRPKGRDFFDVVFLLARTKPNYDFLDFRLNIKNPEELRNHILHLCQNFNFKQLGEDVQPFLFRPSEINRVLQFENFIKTADL